MPSSWSSSLRFELQFTGENVNLWGDKLNVVLQHADYAVAGWFAKALTGNYTLATANAADDEARAAMLKFTGGGPFTVTIPAVSKQYAVWNACTAALTITNGSASATIRPGETVLLMTDGGADLKRILPTDFGSQPLINVASISGLAAPLADDQAATKKYVDDAAFRSAAGNLPGQSGNAGKFLTTNGTVASWAAAIPDPAGNAGKFLTTDGAAQSWRAVATSDLADIATYTAQRNAFAIAAAVAL